MFLGHAARHRLNKIDIYLQGVLRVHVRVHVQGVLRVHANES